MPSEVSWHLKLAGKTDWTTVTCTALGNLLQIRIRATDGGGKSAETTAIVNVQRNMESPQFSPTEYTAEIQDNEPLSSSFLQVAAQDNDLQVRGVLIGQGQQQNEC